MSLTSKNSVRAIEKTKFEVLIIVKNNDFILIIVNTKIASILEQNKAFSLIFLSFKSYFSF